MKPQIVNGGQTINALFDEYRKDDEDWDLRLKKIEVPVKISTVANQDDISEIAYASNNQNPVNDRDLKSRDPRMMQLKKLAEEGVFGNPVFFDIRAGELDYKIEIGEDVSKFGKSPQRLLSNEESGKIAWALLGAASRSNKTQLRFGPITSPCYGFKDFPPSQVSYRG